MILKYKEIMPKLAQIIRPDFSKYRTDIKETISQTGSTLVLPTTDRAVIATAEVF